ncbi:MAG: phosphoesterase RecJ domain-containing protein [Halanaerobium sp. 4-GBenrich]|jgi:phosphoesterase RecJ-like protein|uniref:Phosphoesterase RecJ domain-containing protein n=1 Tax=Halanaerobium congolense TaxID=54121 RepID=A0A1M7GU82_9FIRM|nr:bifunctional oligoribonuclease/PAP phosphatase NrnA [Halanaerobium congolense]ODS50922.1 MAG: phosphoesterase RecJ domain-containing protein [Halanaerobium sp. 4-GBenrich]OEG62381.1 MAG: recombinase RecJ [Halanaerobium sp. MDAL1]PUU92591.1 MAG: phosphoesterase RecJ domain-containing protein [Halanaerobium sp.]PTX17113.1 phosphoesterase RecJ-like protein [Halanaerobium congolense]PXV69327.1 phosphoesterase RecJ-like protein [Halanaerobium congolense]
MQKKIKEIIKLINKNDNFLIVGHVGSDGDSIGSVTAFTRLLRIKNKKVRAYLNRDTLAPFSFLETEGEEFYTDSKKLKKDLAAENYILITLDSGNLERVDLEAEITAGAEFIINIDHHADNSHFGKINLVGSDRAAVGEIIYNFAVEMIGIDIPMQVAEPLATAIITDTGALRYENTTSRVLRILADLMDVGVDIYKINKKIFGSISYKALILKGLALATLERSANGKIAWLYVSRQMMHEAETDYTEGLVSMARDIEDVEIGILFTEEEEAEIKVSLRSNFYAEVNELAAEFNGGGHPRAAGATVEKTLEETINLVVEAAKKYV